MVIILMGVAGSGKTTIGLQLARELNWSFADADDFHPPANIAKMASGQPLDDTDRAPWLSALRQHVDACLARGTHGVVTCSALKERYRAILTADSQLVRFVHLHGTRELLWHRISSRENHFMLPAMLESQLAALEPPANALLIDIGATPAEIVAQIRASFGV